MFRSKSGWTRRLILAKACPVEVSDAAHHVAEGGLGEGHRAPVVSLAAYKWPRLMIYKMQKKGN